MRLANAKPNPAMMKDKEMKRFLASLNLPAQMEKDVAIKWAKYKKERDVSLMVMGGLPASQGHEQNKMMRHEMERFERVRKEFGLALIESADFVVNRAGGSGPLKKTDNLLKASDAVWMAKDVLGEKFEAAPIAAVVGKLNDESRNAIGSMKKKVLPLSGAAVVATGTAAVATIVSGSPAAPLAVGASLASVAAFGNAAVKWAVLEVKHAVNAVLGKQPSEGKGQEKE
ncbi:MAG: hypothetical protein N3G22_00600 [Candidatus Micrarchaeota archaeon]|nr:hypothetical protein [Candidatus Micrarchaeota archaeon]